MSTTRPKRMRIDTSHAVPYGAGVSDSNDCIYIDSSIPEFLRVDGKEVSVWKSTECHETVETALMDLLGFKYADAHAMATAAEHERLEQLGTKPTSYERMLAPYLEDCDKAVREGAREDVPADLSLEPYTDSKDRELVRILQKLQRAAASAPKED